MFLFTTFISDGDRNAFDVRVLFFFPSLLIQVFWGSDTVDPFLNGKNALQCEVETDADYF